MKKFLLAAFLVTSTASGFAQDYISAAPEGGFNIKDGKEYIILYAHSELLRNIGMSGLMRTNNNLDTTQKDNYLEYWVTDWDSKALTLYNVPEENMRNSWGYPEYINATPLYAWGTGVFMAKAKPYDLSTVTDNHHLHIGLRDFGSAPSKYQFAVGSQKTIKSNGFQIEVGIDTGAADGDYVGVGKIAGGNDGKWYYLDIPVADLVDENGDFGFVYDFSQPITDGVFTSRSATLSARLRSIPVRLPAKQSTATRLPRSARPFQSTTYSSMFPTNRALKTSSHRKITPRQRSTTFTAAALKIPQTAYTS